MSPIGDISKISPIGDSAVEITVALEGELTRSQIIFLGDSEAGFSFDSAGDLARLVLIPATDLQVDWDLSGLLTREQFLTGTLDHSWDVAGAMITQKILGTGSLSVELSLNGVLGGIQYLEGISYKELTPTGDLALFRPNYIGYGNIEMTYEFVGNLSSTVMMSGDSSKSIENTGNIRITRFLSGATSIQTDIAGLLSNNAGVQDLKGFLMTRHKTNREMVR